MSPMLPSWMRSRNWRPRLMYRLAIDTTRRRLAWIISCLAARAPSSAARMSRTARWSAPSGMPTSRSTSASSRRAARTSSASVASASDGMPTVRHARRSATRRPGGRAAPSAPFERPRVKRSRTAGEPPHPPELPEEVPPQAHLLVPRLRLRVLLARVAHQVADPDLARAQPLGEREHVAQRVRRPEHGAQQVAFALLDALGDLHLAFACEQLDRRCVAEIDPHRVGSARKRLAFLDGFRRRRTVAVLRGRRLRIVDLLVVDLDRQRGGLGRHLAQRDGDLPSLRLPGGWIHAHG